MKPSAHALALVLAAPLLAPAASDAAQTRTLRAELAAAELAGPVAVENLAGSLRVVAGQGDRLEAVATVHAESAELAASVRFERVAGEDGTPTLRVRYPLDRHDVLRYPGGSPGDMPGWLSGLLGGRGSGMRYDGRRVTVSATRGPLLYADVEVRLPRPGLRATFRNHVGPLSAAGVEGRLGFDTGSGDVALERVAGDLLADTGSGDVSAVGVEGSLRADTGSGDVSVRSFRGERLSADTGSGRITIAASEARAIDLDTGSGDVRVAASGVEEFRADTGSGDVELQAADAPALRRVEVDTGSGDVRLGLGAGASFEVHADQGSGDLVSRYADAEPILARREVVGYRRGDGRTRVEVDTGSGDVVLEPGDPPPSD